VSAGRVERLEKTLARVAREQGFDQERLRRWVSFLALCGVLEHAMEKGVIDTYYLKGGVAMELRFARAARTTKDFDLGLEGNRAERLWRLEEVLKLEFDEFAFRLKPETHQMELADTVRVEVAVQYRTRAWQTVDIDLGPGEAREVDLVEPAVTGPAGRWAYRLRRMCGAWASTSRWLKNYMRARDLFDRIAPGMFWTFCWWTCWASSTIRGRASLRSSFAPRNFRNSLRSMRARANRVKSWGCARPNACF
jgi:Nucleotidyl transferase AbiEii toxin, Type IV TA system